jgi:hypothetical protein
VADPARAVTAKAGERCPRDGRYVACSERRFYPDVAEHAYAEHARTFREGETLPAVPVKNVDADKLYWAWQG